MFFRSGVGNTVKRLLANYIGYYVARTITFVVLAKRNGHKFSALPTSNMSVVNARLGDKRQATTRRKSHIINPPGHDRTGTISPRHPRSVNTSM